MPCPTEDRLPSLGPQVFAICLLLAASLQIIENLLPKLPVFPWLRLGLTYVILMPFLIRFGVIRTLALFVSRNLITLIYGGQPFSAFMISTFSGLIPIGCAGAVLLMAYRKGWLGLLGLCVGLAAAFNWIQLYVVQLLYIHHGDFFFQLGPMLLWSLLSGSLVAWIIHKNQASLAKLLAYSPSGGWRAANESAGDPDIPGLCLWLVAMVSVFWLPGVLHQGLAGILLALSAGRRNLKMLVMAWPFFFYIAWLHLFRTEGVYILKDWISREGLENFLYYSLRTANIIFCGQWVACYVPAFFKARIIRPYAEGFGYAVPLLPALFGLSIAAGKDMLGQMRQRSFENLLDGIVLRIETAMAQLATGPEEHIKKAAD